jgi:Zn-finger protein
MLPTRFRSFGQSVSEEKIFRNWPTRNKNCLWWPCLLTNQNEMCNLYRGPSIYASYQVSVHLAKRFQRRRFLKNQPIRNKNCLWLPCLLRNWDEISILYRGPSIDASYQAGIKKSTNPTPEASNFHIWASWNNQLYARRASNFFLLDIDKLVNIRVSTYIHICYMLFNQQQCFIYSTASFLSKLRAKKVEKLRNSS